MATNHIISIKADAGKSIKRWALRDTGNGWQLTILSPGDGDKRVQHSGRKLEQCMEKLFESIDKTCMELHALFKDTSEWDVLAEYLDALRRTEWFNLLGKGWPIIDLPPVPWQQVGV